MLPSSPERSLVSPADLAQCRQMIRDGSKTFYTASLLLPQRVCDASRALYGFCRVADDLVDGSADSRAAVDTLLYLRVIWILGKALWCKTNPAIFASCHWG